VAGNYDREQIRQALAQTDPAISCYLDLDTGNVVTINEQDNSPATEQLRDAVMAAYGDRYRYISGGNSAADDDAVQDWLDLEGL
jgi:ParB-like chromosome segregation protein Spo0J